MDKSARQIRYYIRLANLIDASLDKADEGSISIKAGAELSFLNVPHQAMVNDYIEKELCTVSEFIKGIFLTIMYVLKRYTYVLKTIL